MTNFNVLDTMPRWDRPTGFEGLDVAGSYARGQQLAQNEEAYKLKKRELDALLADKEAEKARVRELLGSKAALQSMERIDRLRGQGAPPQLLERAAFLEQAKLKQAGFTPPFDAQTWADQQTWTRQGDILRSRVTEASDPKDWLDVQRMAGEYVGNKMGNKTFADPQHARGTKFWQEGIDWAMAEKAKSRPSYSVSLSTGPDLKAKTVADLQEANAKALTMISDYQEIIKKAQPSQFTYGGAVNQLGAHVANKVSPTLWPKTWTEKAVDRRSLMAEIGIVADRYRVGITGAAAPMRELEMIAKRLPGESDNWPEFQKLAQAFMEKQTRLVRLNNRLLANGVTPEDPQKYTQELEKLWKGNDQGKSSNDLGLRVRQLRVGGLDERQMAQMLYDEGYVSEQEANNLIGGGQ